MSSVTLFTEESEVNLSGNDLCGLNDIYRDIADEIGIENTVAIYKMFRGTQVSFPNRLFFKGAYHISLSPIDCTDFTPAPAKAAAFL